MRISVIGHRSVADRSEVIEHTRRILRGIVGDPSGGRPFDLLSCLAEGADRLAIEAAQAWPDMRLIAVLPLPEADYARDFASASSRDEFAVLVGRAHEIIRIDTDASRTDAYQRAGRYVVDHCDHLIAMWDGRPSGRTGGTSDTLAYARSRMNADAIHIVAVKRQFAEAKP